MGGGGRRPRATGAKFRAYMRDVCCKDSHVHIVLLYRFPVRTDHAMVSIRSRSVPKGDLLNHHSGSHATELTLLKADGTPLLQH